MVGPARGRTARHAVVVDLTLRRSSDAGLVAQGLGAGGVVTGVKSELEQLEQLEQTRAEALSTRDLAASLAQALIARRAVWPRRWPSSSGGSSRRRPWREAQRRRRTKRRLRPRPDTTRMS
jgi:hypothetical protein